MKKLDIDISKIICINLKSHNEDQIQSIAMYYNISYEFLLEIKGDGIRKIWLPIGGGYNVAMLDTKNIEDVYFFPHYLPMTARTRKAILSIEPVKTPKKIKNVTKNIDINPIVVVKSTPLTLDFVLDKINAKGLKSLTKDELEFLKNIK